MFQTIIKYESSLCLYGDEGGDYEENKISFLFQMEEEDCIEKCSECKHEDNCNYLDEKATIHHDIEFIDNGEEIFEKILSSIKRVDKKEE